MSAESISYPHHWLSQRSTDVGDGVGDGRRFQQSRTDCRSERIAMATCYSAYELSTPPHQQQQHQLLQRTPTVHVPPQPQQQQQQPQKDYSRPLHVDCSVEYELPNTAKPPQGVRNEPLLMIHPCYFRKIESQRRSPFVNNLPTASGRTSATAAATAVAVAAKRRSSAVRHGQQLQPPVPQQAAPYPVHYAAMVTAAASMAGAAIAAVPERAQHHQTAAVAVATATTLQHGQHHHHHPHHPPHHHHHPHQLWEQMPPLVPISQGYCGSAATSAAASTVAKGMCMNPGNTSIFNTPSGSGDSGHWTDPDRSPDRPEADNKHILSGKYRQYLRAHRLHPYVTSAIPLASTFPQIQQVCYNV